MRGYLTTLATKDRLEFGKLRTPQTHYMTQNHKNTPSCLTNCVRANLSIIVRGVPRSHTLLIIWLKLLCSYATLEHKCDLFMNPRNVIHS